MSGTGRNGSTTAPLLVAVTGPPAAGKTTLARSLAERTRLPLLEKDGIKELLFDSLGSRDRDFSRALSRATFAILYDTARWLLLSGTSSIVEANFAGGTSERELAGLPPCRYLQVVVTAPAETILERFSARLGVGARHPGHHQDFPVLVDEARRALADGRWTRLDLPGETLELDTSTGAEPIKAAARIAAMLTRA